MKVKLTGVLYTVLRVTHEDGHSEGLNETECRPVIDLSYVYVKKINSEVNTVR